MSYFDVVSSNPDINSGRQLADRQADGVEDIYFLNLSGDVTAPKDKLDKVDMDDRVVRRIDPKKLNVDKTDKFYLDDNYWRYVPKTQTLKDGSTLQIWQRVDRQQSDDRKYALIGGKLYEVEFEKDGNAYLTTQVKDLFQNPGFLRDASASEKLAMLQKIERASAYLSFYQSGERYRNLVEKSSGDTSWITESQLKPRKLENDEAVQKLENELKRQTPNKTPQAPLPKKPGEIPPDQYSNQATAMGVAFFLDHFMTSQLEIFRG